MASAVALARSGGWPRVQPGSQSAQILDVLATGQWVSTRELHTRVLCVLHSRVAALRKRGYTILHRGAGFGAEFHEYRLVGTPLDAPAEAVAAREPIPHRVTDGSAGASSGTLTNSGAVDNSVVTGSASQLGEGATSLVWPAPLPVRPPEPLAGQLTVYDALGSPSMSAGEVRCAPPVGGARSAGTPGRGQQSDGGYRFLSSIEWADNLPTVARCAFCPDASFAGTAVECVEWNQAHRAAQHPGLKSVTVRERQVAAKRHPYVQKEAA